MGNNIYDVFCGGVPIQSHLRRLRRNTSGGVTTYVMIMMGMIFMLYLFGFTNLWSDYTAVKLGDNTSLADPSIATGVNILGSLINIITGENGIILGLGTLSIAALLIVGWLTKSTATLLQFVIPIFILLALNIFVFPLNHLTTDIGFMGVGVSSFLFIFFNAFYILAVIEFVRGNA